MSENFTGCGWGYPVGMNSLSMVNFSGDEAKIRESIFIILGTAHGERVMRPDFGSRLSELLFAPMNASTKSLISHYVINALVQWEPRIDVLAVKSEESPSQQGLLQIHIQYRIRATNSMFNLVYPFYLKRESLTNDKAAITRFP